VNVIQLNDTLKIDYDYMEVLKDTLIGNPPKSFYKVKMARWYDTISYLRYDSNLKSIIEYSTINMEETVLFNLNANINDCWDYFLREICFSSSDSVSIFDSNRIMKKFSQYDIPPWDYELAQDFGPIKITYDQSYIYRDLWFYNLIYARFNSIEYGEYITSLEYEHIPSYDFSLEQNYPNPFNPITAIKYSISEKSFVRINIYNILGDKIKKLIAEEKSPGSYTIIFDGSNLSSGAYIYRLESNKFNYSRKMILLK